MESIAQFSRLFMLRKLINLPIWHYLKNIYIPILFTVIVAAICPLLVHFQMESGWQRMIAVGFTSVASVGISAFFIGFTKHERQFFWDKSLIILRIRK